MDSLNSTPIKNNNETEPTQDDECQAIEAHVQGTQEEGQEETQEGGQEINQSVQNSPNKKGLTSEAWKHFRREQIDGKWKAICKYCERKIGGDTKQGTKHLHDHIIICPIRTVRGPKQSILKTVQQSSGSTGTGRPTDSLLVGNFTFSQEGARRALTRWVIRDEHPMSFVEQQGFHEFMAETQPLFKFYTRNTLRSDAMKMYEVEKAMLLKLLGKNSSRIAITTDMWSSDCQNKGYMAITAHFIDDDWNLQNRLVRYYLCF
ncbi:hypothetical protein Ahy_B02g061391 [Arachis hypogaea]|uniref:BED-type domain-containing protein n=1 Tax=Arachis hypogaea TaxID=3818 RepID=A0A445AKU0_ARAHY|nr:hypothetical protein Ahy_B02g061391 [Arachis hypogaea]